jgi:hypothetical protein
MVLDCFLEAVEELSLLTFITRSTLSLVFGVKPERASKSWPHLGGVFEPHAEEGRVQIP